MITRRGCHRRRPPTTGAKDAIRGWRIRLPLAPPSLTPAVPEPRALVALGQSLLPLVPLFAGRPTPHWTTTVYRSPFHFAAAGALSLPPATPVKSSVGERPDGGPSLPLNSLVFSYCRSIEGTPKRTGVGSPLFPGNHPRPSPGHPQPPPVENQPLRPHPPAHQSPTTPACPHASYVRTPKSQTPAHPRPRHLSLTHPSTHSPAHPSLALAESGVLLVTGPTHESVLAQDATPPEPDALKPGAPRGPGARRPPRPPGCPW